MFPPQGLGKKQINSKVQKRERLIKIRAEINLKDNRKSIKLQFLKKINIIDKTLARLTNKKERELKKSINEKRHCN